MYITTNPGVLWIEWSKILTPVNTVKMRIYSLAVQTPLAAVHLQGTPKVRAAQQTYSKWNIVKPMDPHFLTPWRSLPRYSYLRLSQRIDATIPYESIRYPLWRWRKKYGPSLRAPSNLLPSWMARLDGTQLSSGLKMAHRRPRILISDPYDSNTVASSWHKVLQKDVLRFVCLFFVNFLLNQWLQRLAVCAAYQSLITRTSNILKLRHENGNHLSRMASRENLQESHGHLFLGGGTRVAIDCSLMFPVNFPTSCFTKVVCQVVHVRRGEFRCRWFYEAQATAVPTVSNR